jgi:hypothetical protein
VGAAPANDGTGTASSPDCPLPAFSTHRCIVTAFELLTNTAMLDCPFPASSYPLPAAATNCVSSISTAPDTPFTHSAGTFAGPETVELPPSIGAQVAGDAASAAQSSPPYTRAGALSANASLNVAPHT